MYHNSTEPLMNRKSLVVFLLFCLAIPFGLFAQKGGYRIEYVQQRLPKVVYLISYYGDEGVLVDSVKTKKGKAVFQGKEPLPQGVYCIYYANDASSTSTIIPVVLDENQQFLVENDRDGYGCEGCGENAQWLTYVQTVRDMLGGDLPESDVSPQKLEGLRVFVESITSVAPNSLVSKYIRFDHKMIEYCAQFGWRWPNSMPVSDYTKALDFLKDYTDDCYLFHPKMYLVGGSILGGEPSQARLDAFFSTFPANGEIGMYYLRKMIRHFTRENDPAADDILLHLYDTYYVPNGLQLFSEDTERALKRTIERKRRTQIGAEIPAIEVLLKNGKKTSTQDISRKYTVLWFWDPDCEDCQKETPELHQFYEEHSDTYDFEVFGVSITEDLDYWEKMSREWGLTWINSCMALGGYNYDFVEYLNMITTPVSFLLDENHRILLRNFTPEQLQDYFENIDKQ